MKCTDIVPLLSGFLLLGCATQKPLTTIADIDEATLTGVDTVIITGGMDSTATDSVALITPFERIGFLIGLAKESVKQNKFDEANAQMREAVWIIEESKDTSALIRQTQDSLYKEIVAFYTDIMPAEFLDLMPENISVQVFEIRLSRSLDSLKLSTDDSAALATMLCHNKSEYDVPMVFNDRVYRALNFYSRGRKGPVSRWLVRAHYYLPLFRQVFADSGLPQDLAYLPLIESGFNPRAYSPAHASGIWQFISSTGRRYGLRKSYWLDERRSPLQATRSAASYLKKLYGDFSDWHLALAAYNCGEGGVGRAIRRADTADYWQLRLPRETMNYVPQFIAALIIAKNPHCFDFTVDTVEPFDLDTVLIHDCVDMGEIAQALDVPAVELRKLNPHILRWCTPPDHKDVVVYLPAGSKGQFTEFYASLPPEKKVKWLRYRISAGDNLGSISRRFRVPVHAIKSMNNLRSSRIIAGKHLFVPVPANRSVPRIGKSAAPPRSPGRRVVAEPEEALVFKAKGLKPLKYKVRSGDTMYELAKLFNTSVGDICRWNNISRARSIRVGQMLTLYVTLTPNQKELLPRKPRPAPSHLVKAYYKIRRGDNLYSIARRLKVLVDDLIVWNNLDGSHPLIHPGRQLVYHQDPSLVSRQVDKIGASRSSLVDPREDFVRYRVRRGDNLYRLAKLFGCEVGTIKRINKLKGSAIIRPGDILYMPSPKSSGVKTTPAPDPEALYREDTARQTMLSAAYGIRVSAQGAVL
ncbi:MAG: LysM peptidoglycan-binding domain-containing protein [Chitinivibrionales bacterium]|nr:LysM peptidoglycan-binding domain-containing protein [Chitinivibrionales bacterium]